MHASISGPPECMGPRGTGPLPYFGRLVNPGKKIVFKNEFGSFQIKIVMLGKKEIPRYNNAPISSVIKTINMETRFL